MIAPRALATVAAVLASCSPAPDAAFDSPGKPAVASGGGERLAVWYEQDGLDDLIRNSWVNRADALHEQRRTLDATVITETSITAAVAHAGWQAGPTRGRQLVAWADAGAVQLRYLGTETVTASMTIAGGTPALAAGADRFLLATVRDGILYAATVTVDTAAIQVTGELALTAAGDLPTCPITTFHGNRFLVAWRQPIADLGRGEEAVHVRAVDLAGHTAEPLMVLSDADFAGCPTVAVDRLGRFLIGWERRSNHDLVVSAISPGGERFPPVVVARDGFDPALIGGGDRTLLVWDGHGVHGRFLDGELAVDDAFVVADYDGFDYGHGPTASFDGEGYLVAWRGEDRISAVEITPGGRVLAPTNFYSCATTCDPASLLPLALALALVRRRGDRCR